MKKSILSVILLVVLVSMSILPVSASTAIGDGDYPQVQVGITGSVNDGSARLKGNDYIFGLYDEDGNLRCVAENTSSGGFALSPSFDINDIGIRHYTVKCIGPGTNATEGRKYVIDKTVFDVWIEVTLITGTDNSVKAEVLPYERAIIFRNR